MIPVSITWFARKDKNLMIPKMVTGGDKYRRNRINPKKEGRDITFGIHSVWQLRFLIFTIIGAFFIEKDWDYLLLFPQWSEKMNITVSISMEFVINFIVFYAISFVGEEINIKRYNWKLNELEGNDE